MRKISIIGAGAVGSTLAYTLMLRNVASEIKLIDINTYKQRGEVLDITDNLCYVETGCVREASFQDASESDIVIITAGVAQKEGETRLMLVEKNKSIMKSIIKQIGTFKKSAILIIISNPVDVLTYYAQKWSKLPRRQVFGTGTALETSRFKTELTKCLNVYAQNVDGYYLGEHGDSGFVAWSTVSVGGRDIKDLKNDLCDLKKLNSRVRNKVYEIIKGKGSTFYGISMTCCDIVEAVLFNQKKILPLSWNLDEKLGLGDLCLSMPVVVGEEGIIRRWPIKLNASEQKALKKSAETIKKYL